MSEKNDDELPVSNKEKAQFISIMFLVSISAYASGKLLLAISRCAAKGFAVALNEYQKEVNQRKGNSE